MTEYQQFVVIRHGESQTNATNTFQAGNQYDSDPLTPLGAEDADRLAQRLALLPVDLVVSSSYLRARGTAAPIAEVTGAPHVIPVRKGSTWVDLAADGPRGPQPCFAAPRDRRPLRAAGAGVPGPSRARDPACRHGGRRPTRRPLFG
jgi:hypothetical protein